jgi:hypothetical protein
MVSSIFIFSLLFRSLVSKILERLSVAATNWYWKRLLDLSTMRCVWSVVWSRRGSLLLEVELLKLNWPISYPSTLKGFREWKLIVSGNLIVIYWRLLEIIFITSLCLFSAFAESLEANNKHACGFKSAGINVRKVSFTQYHVAIWLF